MTDQELIKAAAKAAGIEIKYQPGSRRFLYEKDLPILEGKCLAYWDPLTDDGDALRLAVKLGLTLQQNFPNVLCYDNPDFADKSQKMIEVCENKRGVDPNAATRRAIVRAAAEIGRTL